MFVVACAALMATSPATFGVGPVHAAVEVDGLFSPGGVLQRGVKVPIFGTAENGDEIIIKIQGFTASTIAKDGKWRVEVGPLEEGGPYTMSLTGSANSLVKNLFVGDVWVCAGESNMQFPISSSGESSDAMLSRKNRELHFYNVKRTGSEKPRTSSASTWSEGGAATVGAFSAIGYYFGRDIQAATDVPIGLIACNHYSSSAEAWTTRETILAEPKLKHLVEDASPGRLDSQTPGRLFNGMVSAISSYPIRGVIFYQGESNIERAEEYRTLFPLMIADWRKAWNDPQLPFLFVQLSGIKPSFPKPNESKLADLRDAQLSTWLQTPRTAMVVSTDHGDAYSQIPKVKEPIGKRLAFAARALVYGEKIEYSGPVFKEALLTKVAPSKKDPADKKEGGDKEKVDEPKSEVANAGDAASKKPEPIKIDAVALTFEHIGDGLMAKEGKLSGFTIAGADEQFVVAEAEVVGDQVILKSLEVKTPKFVRYNWADFPLGNFYNKDGLPASPFRATLGAAAPSAAGEKTEQKSDQPPKPTDP